MGKKKGGPKKSAETAAAPAAASSAPRHSGTRRLGTPNMTLVEEQPEDEAGFSSKPSASDEADVPRAEAGTSVRVCTVCVAYYDTVVCHQVSFAPIDRNHTVANE